MQYEVRWVAISQYHHDALETKMTKEDARRMHVTLEREEYLAVCPAWCYGKDDGWAALVDLWLGQDAEWAPKSKKNRANQGTDGTHGQGNRNHFIHKKVQEEKLKRPLSDIEAWQIAHTRSKSKEGKGDYYGNSGENLKAYEEVYLKAYMEYTRQETMAWQARVAAVQEHNTRMMTSMAAGMVPVMEPPPPPAGPAPVLLIFEEFLAQNMETPGTGGSSVGGGANDGITPTSRSPVTPIHRGGGGVSGGGAGPGGSAAASSEDLGFGRLGGEDLRSGPRRD